MTVPVESLDLRLAALEPIGLTAVDGAAALLTRRDRKYIVPVTVAASLLERLAASCRVLEIGGRRRFRYESVYFDTPELTSYLAAARRRPRRYKVRTRAYLDSGLCLVEVKTRDARGNTVKERRRHPLDRRDHLDADALVFARRCTPLIDGRGASMAPALTTRFRRSTLLIGDDASRATLDTDLVAEAPDGRIARLDGMVIIETKSSGPPTSVDRALWSMGYRPVRVSKYATGLAALHPDLPSNRWTRALREPWIVIPSERRDVRDLAQAV